MLEYARQRKEWQREICGGKKKLQPEDIQGYVGRFFR